MKKLLIVLSILSILVISGCEDIDLSKISDEDMERISEKLIICDEPYIRHGSDCCLDQNKDKICDEDEGELKETKEETPLEKLKDEVKKESGETKIPKTKTKYDLSDYPDFLIKNAVLDGVLVVGDKAPSADVISISNIAVSLAYPTEEIDHPIVISGTMLASEIADIKSKNAILVGSPCINKAIAELFPNFDSSKCVDDYTYSGISKNKGLILVVENNGKTQIIVTGYSQSNVNSASNILSSYKDYNLDGNLITVNKDGKIDNLKETEKKEEETQEPEEKVKEYSMNENIEVDYLTYRVTKAQTFTKMGTSMFKKETDGKFVKVYLEITNNAKETKQIFTPRFKLVDSQNRKFDRFPSDIMYISDYLEFGKQLQPNLEVSGAIVFEVPKDSKDLKLEINGDWLSVTKIIVDLFNVQDISTDTTLKDKQDDMMDEMMEEAEEQVEEIMGKCNSPFKCSSNCAQYSDVGQKDCPSGQVCCMTEQSEVDQQMDDLMEQAEQEVEELMNQCNSPFVCTSSCPQYMDVGQKNCPSGQLCCMQT